MTAPVECHSGYAYAGRPLAVHWQGSRLEIEAIEKEWRGPEGKFFQVRSADGRRFELIYNESQDDWQIKEF